MWSTGWATPNSATFDPKSKSSSVVKTHLARKTRNNIRHATGGKANHKTHRAGPDELVSSHSQGIADYFHFHRWMLDEVLLNSSHQRPV